MFVQSNMNCISFFGVIPSEILLNSCSIFCNVLCEINGERPERGGGGRDPPDPPIHIFQMNLKPVPYTLICAKHLSESLSNCGFVDFNLTHCIKSFFFVGLEQLFMCYVHKIISNY